MTGVEDFNRAAFAAEAARLRAMGFEVVNPAEIVPEGGGTDWERYMRADLRAMLTCDTVALLPGWERSRGAHLEVHVAHRVGIDVVFAGGLDANTGRQVRRDEEKDNG